ncbi:GNAT family N-acetyltransferase [Massilia sp. IC2-477]|uniref:GNAT family N-acetyltransferase n=1 Tax=Massilia sp. IC2-477 TaxID=2887198 RepID=UPI001D0F6182|nr:GNAT family N-acetyltransferase [Massilia sp. IC2-477]MCC2958065.1 GNAT family N-acetyltransferase [Massilia sp. IC2-477]
MAGALIRRLRPDDGPAYRSIRLRALEDSPEAFGSSLAEEAARPLDSWSARLDKAAVSGIDCPLVAELDGDAVGLVWAKVDADDPDTVNLYQMWVAPQCRGRGVAAALLDAALAWARERGAHTVGLGVNCANRAAVSLYERAGFTVLGEAYPMAGAPGRMEYAMRLRLNAAP